MDFLELAKKRYSVRKFSNKKIENYKIEKVLEAARLSPTATNAQPQKIYIINDSKGMKKLEKVTPYCFNAKAALIVCYDKEKSWKRIKFDGEDSGDIDSAIVGTHIMLQLADMGLGTTWVGYFDPIKIKEEFNIPNNIVPKAIFPIGYPSEDSLPSDKHFKRKNISEIVEFL